MSGDATEADIAAVCDWWPDVEDDVKEFLADWQRELGTRLKTTLGSQRDAAIAAETERYNSRQGEVSKLIAENTVEKLRREIAEADTALAQLTLFDEDRRAMLRGKEELEAELRHRTQHYEQLRTLLAAERERITHNLLPRRYAMSGDAHIFPVALEVRLP